MPISPYAKEFNVLLAELNQVLQSVFELRTPYNREHILAGERYGFIDLRSSNPTDRRQVVTGFEVQEWLFEIVLTVGCEDFSNSLAVTGEMFAELDAGIAKMKRLLPPGSLHDFKRSGGIESTKRQSLKAPHPWLLDVSCEVSAPVAIYKDKNGEHALPPTKSLKENINGIRNF